MNRCYHKFRNFIKKETVAHVFPVNFAKFVKARIHCEIYLSDYFMKHNLMYISLYLIWFHEIRIKYVKRKPPRTIIRKVAIFQCLPRLHVVNIGWPVSHEKVILTGDCFFHYFTRDKNWFVHYRIQVILIIK